MFHACIERFDVMGETGNILGWDGEVNTPLLLNVTGYQVCILRKVLYTNKMQPGSRQTSIRPVGRQSGIGMFAHGHK